MCSASAVCRAFSISVIFTLSSSMSRRDASLSLASPCQALGTQGAVRLQGATGATVGLFFMLRVAT